MKLIYIFLPLILLIACSENKKPIAHASKINITQDNDTTPSIGNCYIYSIKKDSIIGLLLAGISNIEDSVYYNFFISGKVFNIIPDKEQFRKAGIAGLNVPGPYAGQYQKTFCQYGINKKDLLPLLSKMILIDKVSNLSNKNQIGSSSTFTNPEILATEYNLFDKMNAENKEQSKLLNFPLSAYEVFDWNSLSIATNEEDIAKEETVWVLSKKTANPAAAKLMNEEWFWSPIDDLSPFGNDDGRDALHIFKDWRERNLKTEPAAFLDVLEKRWGMSFAHKNVISEKDLVFVEQTNQYYRNIDMAIIGVCFGQIVLEGKLSKDLKDYGIKAIQRTLLPIGMSGMAEGSKEEYRRRLKIMLDILNQF